MDLKNKFCFSKKFRLFNRGGVKLDDYEYVPYQKEKQQTKHQPETNRKESVKMRNSFDDIETSLDSFYTSEDDTCHKISSTLIQTTILSGNNVMNNAYSNRDYESPDMSSSFNVTQSIHSCSCFNTSDSLSVMSSSNLSSSSSGSNTSSIQSNEIYVCCKEFKACIQGDLNLKFADRVKLIHLNEGYALVENVISGQYGYVPFECIKTLNEFLNHIKLLNRS